MPSFGQHGSVARPSDVLTRLLGRGALVLAVTSRCQQKNMVGIAPQVRMAFEGSISEAFEDSLRHYVAEEERELMAFVQTCIQVRQLLLADGRRVTRVVVAGCAFRSSVPPAATYPNRACQQRSH